ncbi:MAG: hypothetical protein AB8B64_11935 [Granulosicoccus sp.]
MPAQDRITEFTMMSPLPGKALVWLYAFFLIASLYIVRALIEDIPPQDHVALSFILCFLLTQVWCRLEQTRLRISLPYNRCWLRHHHLGKYKEQSLPVSQIHSAKLEYDDSQTSSNGGSARIVLVTSLGMIPVSLTYSEKARLLDQSCHHINCFLESQKLYFQA